MTTITFDLRVGGGTEPLIGGVTLTPTRVRYDTTSVIMPRPQTIGLHNGKGTMTGVAPTPDTATPSWAYTAEIIDGTSGTRRSWLVAVPNTGTVAFDDLTQPVQVTSPSVDINKIADDLDAAATAAQDSFVAATQADGDLILTRTNGQNVNVGRVQGDQGLPGVNAVPADEAVATYTSTSGTASHAAMVNLMQVVLSDLILNVKDYGAKGDGATDDTAAIQAAINAANPNGAAISFPAGTYAVSGSIRLKSNLTLTGPGATIRKIGTSDSYLVFYGTSGTTTGYGAGVSNVTVQGLTFRGDLATNRSCGAFLFHRGSHITIDRCQFIECVIDGHAIDLLGCEDVLIDGCVFAGANPSAARCYVEAVQLDASSRYGWGGTTAQADGEAWDGIATRGVTVRNSRFIPHGNYPAPCALGSHSGIEGAAYTDIEFTGNLVYGQPTPPTFDSYYGQLHFLNAQRVRITGNVFRSDSSDPQVAMRFYRGASVVPMSDLDLISPSLVAEPANPIVPNDILISGNTFLGYGHTATDRSVVEVYGWSAEKQSAYVSVAGNRIIGADTNGPMGVNVSYCLGLAVTGNTITGLQRAVRAYGGNAAAITGNTLVAAPAATSGVFFSGPQTNSTVVGNAIIGFPTPVELAAAATKNVVANNNAGA